MGTLVKMAAAQSSHVKHKCQHISKLYLSTISLMRAGDVETNPGPGPGSEPQKSFDDTLRGIANNVTDNGNIERLGKALGFGQGEIDNYLKTNMRFHRVTSEGTLQMLHDWHINVTEAEERSVLREALLKAKLRRIADEHLPEVPGGQLHKESTQPSQTGGSGPLQETELVCLARIIDPSYYDDVGTHLGIPYAELKQLRVNHPTNVKGALTEAFMTWNTREKGGNKREILAEALKESQLVDLAERLLSGRLSN